MSLQAKARDREAVRPALDAAVGAGPASILNSARVLLP